MIVCLGGEIPFHLESKNDRHFAFYSCPKFKRHKEGLTCLTFWVIMINSSKEHSARGSCCAWAVDGHFRAMHIMQCNAIQLCWCSHAWNITVQQLCFGVVSWALFTLFPELNASLQFCHTLKRESCANTEMSSFFFLLQKLADLWGNSCLSRGGITLKQTPEVLSSSLSLTNTAFSELLFSLWQMILNAFVAHPNFWLIISWIWQTKWRKAISNWEALHSASNTVLQVQAVSLHRKTTKTLGSVVA